MITIENQLAITQLHGLYADAIHRLDGTAWSSCWAPDAQWSIATLETPTEPMLIEGRDNIVQMWQGAMTVFTQVQHKLHSHHIFESDHDNQLKGRSYLSESFLYEGEHIELFGLYQDTFVEIEKQWLFKTRRFSILQMKKPNSDTLYLNYPDLDV